jgi:hypothetical protein
MSPNTKLTNQYGAETVACPEHLPSVRPNICGDVKEAPTDEKCTRCASEASGREATARLREAGFGRYADAREDYMAKTGLPDWS